MHIVWTGDRLRVGKALEPGKEPTIEYRVRGMEQARAECHRLVKDGQTFSCDIEPEETWCFTVKVEKR